MSTTYIHPAKRERIKNREKLQKSRPLTTSNFHHLKGSYTGKSFGPDGHNYVPVGPSFPRSSVTKEQKRRLDALGVIGGKKSRKRRRKKRRKKKKKSRRRKKKAGFLLEGALGYYLYQTKMKGKKANFNWPVSYTDPPPPPEPIEQTPPQAAGPAKGGKKSRKKRRKKRKKTRKRRGGSDSLRDGIRKIYEGKKSMNFGVIESGPGSWGTQLNDLYDKYQEHLERLSSGQKFARKMKNIFRKGDSKKPLTEGEADHIFYEEAKKMRRILDELLPPIRQSIDEINMNPNAMYYSDEERRSDPEKARLSSLLDVKEDLGEKQKQIGYSINQLDILMMAIKRSYANSISSSFDGYQGSMDSQTSSSDSSFNTDNLYNFKII